MSEVDPRLVAAMREQLSQRPAGAARVGWKFGSGEEEQIDGDHVVGQVTSATLLADGATYRGGGAELQADVELAVELGDDLAPLRYGLALEICDLAGKRSLHEVILDNDHQRAVAFGQLATQLPPGLRGALVVNGVQRAAGPAPDDLEQRVRAVDRVLAASGERLEPGDRIITGLIVSTPIRSGDEVAAELGELGRVTLRIA